MICEYGITAYGALTNLYGKRIKLPRTNTPAIEYACRIRLSRAIPPLATLYLFLPRVHWKPVYRPTRITVASVRVIVVVTVTLYNPVHFISTDRYINRIV